MKAGRGEDGHRTEQKHLSEEDLKNLVMKVNSFFGKTTPSRFVEACSTDARDHFRRLFARLDVGSLTLLTRRAFMVGCGLRCSNRIREASMSHPDRLRDELQNGRSYYRLDGAKIAAP
mgnify:CR=1 FL=1